MRPILKALDYSLFRAGKEMLYLPLSYGEKTRGKALVDIPRSAKEDGHRVVKVSPEENAYRVIIERG